MRSGDLQGLHAYLKCGERILESRIKPGSQEIYYPVIAAVTAPALLFVPPAFFGTYSKNWPLPRSMVRAPSPTLKIVFSPRRVIVLSLKVSSLRDWSPVFTAVHCRTLSFTTAGRADAFDGSSLTSWTT